VADYASSFSMTMLIPMCHPWVPPSHRASIHAGFPRTDWIFFRTFSALTVRPSLAFYNTCEEVDRLVAVVARLAGQRMLPSR
jgi:selenocysteine lyase/cysteine desulfurase